MANCGVPMCGETGLCAACARAAPLPPAPPLPTRIHAYSNAEAFAEPVGASARLAEAVALLKEIAWVWSGACEKKCGRCLECRVAKAAGGLTCRSNGTGS